MKKLLAFFLTAVLLVTVLAVPAMAAGSKIEGPDGVHAGDTVTVIFSAGKVYKGAYSGSGTVTYNTDLLTLQGYTSLMEGNWSVAFFGNEFSFQSTPGTAPLTENVPIFSATFVINPDVPAWTAVTVAVEGIVMFNGEYDVGADRVYWSRSVQKSKGNNVSLKQLSVENFSLSPSFDPERLYYAVAVPYETDTITIKAQTADAKASVSIPAVETIPVGESTCEIVVTAENGDVRTYSLTLIKAEPVQSVTEPLEETVAATEPATETTEPATEPTTEATEETEPTLKPAATDSAKPSSGMSKTTIGVLWILSVVAAFVGGLVAPMIIGLRD